jgi:hypothetical protein
MLGTIASAVTVIANPISESFGIPFLLVIMRAPRSVLEDS